MGFWRTSQIQTTVFDNVFSQQRRRRRDYLVQTEVGVCRCRKGRVGVGRRAQGTVWKGGSGAIQARLCREHDQRSLWEKLAPGSPAGKRSELTTGRVIKRESCEKNKGCGYRGGDFNFTFNSKSQAVHNNDKIHSSNTQKLHADFQALCLAGEIALCHQC